MSDRLSTPKPPANATPLEIAREKQRAAPPPAPASAAVPMIDGMTIEEFIKASAEKLRHTMLGDAWRRSQHHSLSQIQRQHRAMVPQRG